MDGSAPGDRCESVTDRNFFASIQQPEGVQPLFAAVTDQLGWPSAVDRIQTGTFREGYRLRIPGQAVAAALGFDEAFGVKEAAPVTVVIGKLRGERLLRHLWEDGEWCIQVRAEEAADTVEAPALCPTDYMHDLELGEVLQAFTRYMQRVAARWLPGDTVS